LAKYHKTPYIFFLGFAKNRDKTLGKEAHAWITAGPIAKKGGHSFTSHQVVLSYTNLPDFYAKSQPFVLT
tara:strand:+ start:822 stop:1031 length:210 start_codon:yes stop_codon:yes gene_type:complete